MKTFENKAPPPRYTPLETGELEIRIEQLRKWYPEWFWYTDSLGERPIDGMLRTMRQDWEMRKEIQEQHFHDLYGKEQQVERNRQIAPEYTQEEQKAASPNHFIPMGPVM